MLFVDLNDNFSCKENYNLAGRSLIRLVFVWGALWTTTPAAPDAYDIRHHHSQTDPTVGTWLCLWCTLPPSFKESTEALIEVKTTTNLDMWRVLVLALRVEKWRECVLM